MPFRAWIPLLVLTLVIGGIFRMPLWVMIPALVLSLVAIAHAYRVRSLDGVSYRRVWHYRRGFPGERLQLRIEVENKKLLPLSWLHTEDPWPEAVAPEDTSVMAPSAIEEQLLLMQLFSLRWYEKTSRSYALLLRQRGFYQVGPAKLTSGDLFGLFEKQTEAGPVEAVTVFPEVLPLPLFDLRAEDPFGDRRTRRRIFEDPNQTIGVRGYHPEDDFRRVHWPATARTGELQVRIYQTVSSQVMVVCLNVSTLPFYWEGMIPDMLEQLVKVAATLAYRGTEAGYAVGLVSNGCLAHADQPFRLAPGRSPDQLARLLGLLAGVTPLTTVPFAQYLLRAMSDVPYGATLVVVSAIQSEELTETLVRLMRYRPHLTLVSLAEEAPPDVPGMNIIHLPYRPVSRSALRKEAAHGAARS